MLPSKKRLSRSEVESFLSSKSQKTTFNALGTLKYIDASENKSTIVISSKNEKSAVKRNKLRRRIYSLFFEHFKKDNKNRQYVFYVSKNATKKDFSEIKTLFYELINKTTK